METAITTFKIKSKIPSLRFKEFHNSFTTREFNDICEITRLAGYEYSEYWKEDENEEIIALRGYNVGKGKLELIDLAYISNQLSLQLKRSRLYKGDIVYPCVGSIGNAVVIEENDKYHIQQNIAKITCKEGFSPYFLMQFLISHLGMREVFRFNASGAQPNVLVGSLRKFRISCPSFAEQQKIAYFLSAVDKKIQQLARKKELMEQYKKGVMQQIFSRKLRFKDENGRDFSEWEEKKLGDIAKKVTLKNKGSLIKNVLTNSASQGIVSQSEYFERDIANQNNLENYFIVNFDDFVYNPRVSVHAPVGPIKRNKLEKGVMSPLYLVFTIKENVLEYFEFYFETDLWHSYLGNVANIGARHDRMNITNSDFFNMKIPFPCEKERQNISNYISSLNTKIDFLNKELIKTQTFKKGLLQQMFC